ncbi:MAG TPA: class I SAM-dependent methyltransferase [Chitinispirillaceae bacterium]|nr:class I SAM-dependent methyltransferase [Chitinispirillaceae bacterium]
MIKRFIAQQFRQPTGFFGKIVGKLMAKGNLPVINETIQRLEISDEDIILEIGYGPGLGIMEILSTNSKCTMKGIDFSDLMYKIASKRNRKFIQDKRLELFNGDFLSFELKSNSFSKVFGVNVIYFWPDLPIAATKIKSILKPSGKAVLYMSHKEDLVKISFTKTDVFYKYDIDTALTAFRNAGFSAVSSGESMNGSFRCYYITVTN